MAAAERLQVGAVGERHLDLDEHVALVRRLGPRHVLEPQVAGAVEDERPHAGFAVTEPAPPSRPTPPETAASASSKRSSGNTVGAGRSSVGRSATACSMCADVDERDPITVSSRRYMPAAGSVPASAKSSTVPPGSTAASAVSPPPGGAKHGRVHRPVRRHARALRQAVDREHGVAAPLQHGAEEAADEAVADHEHASARHPLGAAQHARERLDVGAVRVVDSGRGARPTPWPARARRTRRGRSSAPGSCSQVDSCPERQRGHSPQPVWWIRATRRPSAVSRHDLVPEHRSGSGDPDLLHIRAAEPAGEHRHAVAGRRRLLDLGQRGLTGGA